MHKKFQYPIKVVKSDIDAYQHVNNEVYLRWLLEAASAHSESLGYTLEKFMQEGAGFVVRKHELEYLLPAYLDEELVVETWVGESKGARSYREYHLIRIQDQKLILQAKTLWVYIDLKNGRPILIPQEIREKFSTG